MLFHVHIISSYNPETNTSWLYLGCACCSNANTQPRLKCNPCTMCTAWILETCSIIFENLSRFLFNSFFKSLYFTCCFGHSWNISTNLRIPESLAGLSDHTNASCSEEVCENIVQSQVEDAYRSLSSKPVQVDIQPAKHRYKLETTSSRNFL